MKQLREKTWAKCGATATLLLSCLLLLASCIGILFLSAFQGYDDATGEIAQENALSDALEAGKNDAHSYYTAVLQDETAAIDYYKKRLTKENSNFFFTLTDTDGNVKLENYQYHDALQTIDADLHFEVEADHTVTYRQRLFDPTVDAQQSDGSYGYYDNGSLRYIYWKNGDLYDATSHYSGHWEYDGKTTTITIYQATKATLHLTGGIAADLHAQDNTALFLKLLRMLLPLRYWLFVFAALGLLIALFCLGFLLYSTGHKAGVPEIYLAPWHRIPLDLVLVAAFFLAVGLVELLYYPPWYGINSVVSILAIVGIAIVAFFAALYLLLTVVVRCKAGKWWRNTICYRLLRLVWRGIQHLAQLLPLIWKTALGCLVVLLLEFCFFVLGGSTSFVFWALERLALVAFVFLIALQLRKLHKQGQSLAAGDLHARMDPTGMLPELRRHAEDLNRIGDGMNAAVEARMRSERLKTELITNVSHDLKTPLTSICNYVDLMSQLETLAPQEAREYLGVLQLQSARLKKLTEDLIEASKASSGVIPVHLAPTNLVELLRQATGEYDQRLAQGNLKLCAALPEQCSILADGRLLWRVLDNLLSNCCKYAMPGTRVYLTVTAGESKAALILKNVSREMLTVDPAQLTERFVRADASRSSEGSGLGLAIAQSLTQLQHGTFTLGVDGDLFKVTLAFPLAAPDSDTETA